MQIDVQALGFELTPALRSHAVRRLHFALGRSNAQVSRLSVRLSDLNGPRGGEDKRCQVRVKLTDAPEVVIEDTEADLSTPRSASVARHRRSLGRPVALIPAR